MTRRAAVLAFGVVSLAACSTEKEVDTPSLDVTVEVSGACRQAGCDLAALDEASLYRMSWQLYVPAADGVEQLYGCGESKDVAPLASLQAVLKRTDGGTLTGPLSIGPIHAPTAFQPARQIGTGGVFNLSFDGGIDTFSDDILLVDQGPGYITVRYAVSEVSYGDGRRRQTPGLDVVEAYRYSVGSRRVRFLYDAICAPSTPTGFY